MLTETVALSVTHRAAPIGPITDVIKATLIAPSQLSAMLRKIEQPGNVDWHAFFGRMLSWACEKQAAHNAKLYDEALKREVMGRLPKWR